MWVMEHEKILSLVCIALLAAFDTVAHEILLKYYKTSMELQEQFSNGINHISDLEVSRSTFMMITQMKLNSLL